MKTINLFLSDAEYEKFGLKSDSISFSVFLELVQKELTRQRLIESVQMAEKYGLSEMSMDEITEEVKAVRKNAKNNPGH